MSITKSFGKQRVGVFWPTATPEMGCSDPRSITFVAYPGAGVPTLVHEADVIAEVDSCVTSVTGPRTGAVPLTTSFACPGAKVIVTVWLQLPPAS